jgi:heme exporter protein A
MRSGCADPPVPASPAATLLDVEGLAKSYGGPTVLRSVCLSVAAGEGLAILGPNGAGKSTLLRILAGIHRASSGQIRIEGIRARFRDGAVRRKIGFVSHETFLYDALTARENLRFFGRLYGIRDTARIAEALRAVGLHRVADRPVGSFSRGMAQRLTLARACLHRPCLLLLDEPFTGLDPAAAGHLEETLHRWRREGGAFVMATHDLAHVVGVASRLVILRSGRIVHEEDLRSASPARLDEIYRTHAGGGVGVEGA